MWAGGNTLVALPPSIGELGELAVLSLTSNRLVALPVELCACARLERLLLDDNRLASLPDGLHALRACVELGLSANLLHAVPHSLPPHLEILRLNSNSLEEAPVWERVPRETFLFDNPCAAPRSAGRRPLVAVLLPGLVRSYAHGAHWRAFFARYAEAYDLRAFLYVWPIRGAVANNFSQEADRAAGEPLDVHRLEESYPVRRAGALPLRRCLARNKTHPPRRHRRALSSSLLTWRSGCVRTPRGSTGASTTNGRCWRAATR